MNTSKPVETWLPEQISDLLDFANTAGSLATTKKGVIRTIPDEDQIRDTMKNMPASVNG